MRYLAIADRLGSPLGRRSGSSQDEDAARPRRRAEHRGGPIPGARAQRLTFAPFSGSVGQLDAGSHLPGGDAIVEKRRFLNMTQNFQLE